MTYHNFYVLKYKNILTIPKSDNLYMISHHWEMMRIYIREIATYTTFIVPLFMFTLITFIITFNER